MEWSYTLFIPAVVCLIFPVLMIVTKKKMTRAQMMFNVTLLMEGFSMVVIGVAFAGAHRNTFIYDFIFKEMILLCISFQYLGICSLTEPKGPTLRQRQSVIVPLAYVVGISIAGSILGPRRYGEFCNSLFEYNVHFIPSDGAWNFMLIWSFYVFYAVVVIFYFTILLMATRKLRIFRKRVNDIYAKYHHLPKLNLTYFMLHMWGLCILCLVSFFIIIFLPQNIEVMAWPLSIALTIVQLSLCIFNYNADYDARYLNTLVVSNTK